MPCSHETAVGPRLRCGVPQYIIADRYWVSGAQPPEVLVEAVREAAGSGAP